jgi:hypothetical protein
VIKPEPPPVPPPPRLEGGEAKASPSWFAVRFTVWVIGIFILGFGFGRSVVHPRTVVVVPPPCDIEFQIDDAEATTWEVH